MWMGLNLGQPHKCWHMRWHTINNKHTLTSVSYFSAAQPWCLTLTCLNNSGCAWISIAPTSLPYIRWIIAVGPSICHNKRRKQTLWLWYLTLCLMPHRSLLFIANVLWLHKCAACVCLHFIVILSLFFHLFIKLYWNLFCCSNYLRCLCLL